jgi:hypothetical protein
MKNIALHGTLMILMACGVSKPKETPDVVPPGFTSATVRDYRGLDGCEFLLIADDSTRFEPVNLDETFKENGLRVYFKYKPVDGMSICMTGKRISITELRKVTP